MVSLGYAVTGTTERTSFGRFRLVRELGAGATGVVWEALDPDRGLVALKRVGPLDTEARDELKREFRAVSRIFHRNLVHLYELGEFDGSCYFSMELIRGQRLFDHLRPDGVPDYDRIRAAAIELTRGLLALHREGVLHCDVKPGNVLVEDASGRVVLVDFATSLSMGGSEDPRLHGWAGTPAYFSPERILGGPMSEAWDWYSLGVLLFEAMTGRKPFEDLRTSLAASARHQLRYPDEAGAPLVAVANGLLERREADRWSAAEVLDTLGAQHPPSAHAKRAGDGASGDRCDGFARAGPVKPALIGRRSELTKLRAALAGASDGARIVRISGASGIGKSCLLEEFLTGAKGPDRLPLILASRCFERESVPYKALDGALDALARDQVTSPNPVLSALTQADGALLKRMFPAFGRVAVLPDGDAGTLDRRRAFLSLRRIVSAIAAERPVILSVDDAQWGDRDSARCLIELLADPVPANLLIVLAHRDGGDRGEFLAELLEGLPRGIDSSELSLSPLDSSDAASIALAILGADRREVAERIGKASAGLPFVAEALARTVHAGRDDGQAPNISELVSIERARLAPEQRTLLDLLAVADAPLEHRVVLAAAGLDQDRTELERMVGRGLVRINGPRRRDSVELYHDALRGPLLSDLSLEARRALHRALAVELERSTRADAYRIARHYREGGDLCAALRFSLEAARRAERALAFDRAAESYAFALSCRLGAEEEASIATLMAGALASAGRLAEAAPLYRSAAEHLPERSLELRRMAAEHYLASGMVDDGLAVLQTVLQEAGLTLPSPAKATRSILRLLPRVILRGLFWRPGRDVRDGGTRTTEICFSAGKGLSPFDPLVASTFMLEATLRAMTERDSGRAVQGIAYTGILLSYGPGTLTRSIARALIDRAHRLAHEIDDPTTVGFALGAKGVALVAAEDWRGGLRCLEESHELLGAETVGTKWERTAAATTALLALMSLGDLSVLGRRIGALLRAARDEGDVFTMVEALLYASIVALAEGEVAASRQRIDEAMASFTSTGFLFQHWAALRNRTMVSLYEGSTDLARERICKGIEEAKRAGLLSVQIIRIEALWLSGAIDLLESGAASERTLSRLRREHSLWARGLERLLSAGTIRRSNLARAQRLLREAVEAFRCADMGLFAACAELALAELSGETERAERVAGRLRALGIHDPRRWMRIYAPGFALDREAADG